MFTHRRSKILLSVLLFMGIIAQPTVSYSQANDTTSYLPIVFARPAPVYRVNAPYFNVADVIASNSFREMAVFWFGRVTSNENMTDVRVGYNNTGIYIYVAVYDRLFWYDKTPTLAELPLWDSFTVYINTAGVTGQAPGLKSFRFDSQIYPEGAQPPPASYKAAYQGSGTGWTQVSNPFETLVGARGEYPFNSGGDNRGWVITYKIPFSSLGVSTTPANGTTWGLALTMHDRDNESGSIFLESSWPPNVNLARTSSWGHLRFGLPQYSPPAVPPAGNVTIRQNNTLQTPDGDVGGHFMCGEGIDFWTEWGNTVYYLNHDGSLVGDMNIGNGADIADWPCFSKYYITFPLDSLPGGKVILSAAVTLHQFGTSGNINDPNPAYRPVPSPIQVLVVDRDFEEQTLSWNSAPMALENVSLSWVPPYQLPENGWPGEPRAWDITYAVANAYQRNQPLRLAFYSADNAYHSGRHFTSADVGDWDLVGRPTLTITFGNP